MCTPWWWAMADTRFSRSPSMGPVFHETHLKASQRTSRARFPWPTRFASKFCPARRNKVNMTMSPAKLQRREGLGEGRGWSFLGTRGPRGIAPPIPESLAPQYASP